MNIYLVVKELAAQSNISIAELERRLNFSNGSIWQWRKHMPSANRLNKVARYFGLTMNDILSKAKSGTEVNVEHSQLERKKLFNEKFDSITHSINQLNDCLLDEFKSNKKARDFLTRQVINNSSLKPDYALEERNELINLLITRLRNKALNQ